MFLRHPRGIHALWLTQLWSKVSETHSLPPQPPCISAPTIRIMILMLIIHNDLNNAYESSKKMVVVTRKESLAAAAVPLSTKQCSESKSGNSTVLPSPISQSRSPETTCLSHESLPFGCSWDPSKCRNFQTSKTQELFKSWAPVAAQAPLAQRTPILVVGSRTFLSMWCPKIKKFTSSIRLRYSQLAQFSLNNCHLGCVHFQAGNLMHFF